MKKRRFFSRGNGRGSIILICGLLVSSAVIRLGTEAGKAVATENPFPTATADSGRPAKKTPDESPEAISEMLQAFQRREERIRKLEEEIAMRQKALQVADEEIERRLQVLQQAEESLREMLTIADSAAENDLATLTSVYENMKPKEAAALFEEMEPDFAAGFLGRMRPDAAAGIMAGLSPQKAYTISVILAGRNAEAPKG